MYLQEELLEVLSEHIDSLADASHYFVVDPTDTTIVSAASKGGGVGGGARLAKRAIVFSDWRDHAEGCVNKFSLRSAHTHTHTWHVCFTYMYMGVSTEAVYHDNSHSGQIVNVNDNLVKT